MEKGTVETVCNKERSEIPDNQYIIFSDNKLYKIFDLENYIRKQVSPNAILLTEKSMDEISYNL